MGHKLLCDYEYGFAASIPEGWVSYPFHNRAFGSVAMFSQTSMGVQSFLFPRKRLIPRIGVYVEREHIDSFGKCPRLPGDELVSRWVGRFESKLLDVREREFHSGYMGNKQYTYDVVIPHSHIQVVGMTFITGNPNRMFVLALATRDLSSDKIVFDQFAKSLVIGAWGSTAQKWYGLEKT